jgi:hypothetical protein
MHGFFTLKRINFYDKINLNIEINTVRQDSEAGLCV